MVEGENDESSGAAEARWNPGATQDPRRSHPPGVKPVFVAEPISAAAAGGGGGYVKYSFIGNYTRADINSMLESGNVLYEFVDNEPTRLTIVRDGGAKHKSRRKGRRVQSGKKTKRYSIFTK
jgi:hypothetical protein